MLVCHLLRIGMKRVALVLLLLSIYIYFKHNKSFVKANLFPIGLLNLSVVNAKF